ncbi:DUF397 domain-containing protein [Streptomyces sp. NPDC001157]
MPSLTGDRGKWYIRSERGLAPDTYSGAQGGECVEVIDGYAAGVPVRDSKDKTGPALVFSAAGWASFVAAVQRDEFPV